MRRITGVGLAAAVAVMATGCGTQPPASSSATPFDDVAADRVSFQTKQLVLTPLDAHTAESDLRRQRGVVVNFWSPGCAPCADEAPILRRLQAEGFTVVGVDISGGPANSSRDFAASQGWTFPQFRTAPGSARRMAIIGTPTTWFVDPDGTVVYQHIGVLRTLTSAERQARATRR